MQVLHFQRHSIISVWILSQSSSSSERWAYGRESNLLDVNVPNELTFPLVYSYYRIYTSARALWSVWYQFDLIPMYTREWNPTKGWWLAPWMRYQIFAPLFILLLLNLFWYMLMWRVLIRGIMGNLKDEREEGEYDEEEEAAEEERKQMEAEVNQETKKSS